MKYLNSRGSATVAVAGLLIAMMMLFSFGAAGSGALITKHKLNSATDLAALSAAMSLPQVSIACQVAATQLQNSGFQLTNCQGGELWVSLTTSANISILSYPIQLNSEAMAGW
jgi:secretion/DNA translocation related TadE-like protein